MRISKGALLAFGAILFMDAASCHVAAQDIFQPGPAQPQSHDLYASYEAADTAGAATVVGDATVISDKAADAVPDKSKDDGKGDGKEESKDEKPTCRWCHDGKMGDPWTLPQACFLKENGIEIHGWGSAGMDTNAHGAASNGPLGFNNFTDFNLNQLMVYAEKKVDTEKNCFDVGGRVDYLYGIDGPKTQAFGDQGWDSGWNSSNRYGSAIPQMYVEFAFGDWDIKGGRFWTPIGFEVVPATGNFFYSHSYTCYYAEPFTHTGFLVTKKVDEKLSVFGGWVDGWDSGWGDRNNEGNFLGGVNLTMSEKATLGWTVTAGNWGSGKTINGVQLTTGDIYMNSFVLTLKITDKWTWVGQHDLGINSNTGSDDTAWYGLNQELTYKVNDCWSTGGRFEWFRDQDGARVVAGNAGNYYEATLGVNYKPHANLLLRPEVRWDWYDGQVANNNHPFDNGNSNNQFSGGFDMIFTF
jgi:hypothetical protein